MGDHVRIDPGNCVRYTPSDVFETFPLPSPTERLGAAGRSLDKERNEIMLRRDLGLTKLYNLVNDLAVHGDADVDLLRMVHAEIDAATVEAYGWDDLDLDHGFNSFRQAQRWTIGPEARVECMDRLLLENHRRSHEGRGDEIRNSRSSSDAEGTLFG